MKIYIKYYCNIMTPAQLSFTIPDKNVKDLFMKKTKSQGISMKAAIFAFMKDYINNSYSIELKKENVKNLEKWDDTIMTEENKKDYESAMKDLENGVNWISQEEMFAKYL